MTFSHKEKTNAIELEESEPSLHEQVIDLPENTCLYKGIGILRAVLCREALDCESLQRFATQSSLGARVLLQTSQEAKSDQSCFNKKNVCMFGPLFDVSISVVICAWIFFTLASIFVTA